jgi:hypothetical protein
MVWWHRMQYRLGSRRTSPGPGFRGDLLSTPILIWTLRRTGGTTLTSLLDALSEYPTIDQEPFNWDRCFGAVARAWHADRRLDHLEVALQRVLADRPTIKHCYELHADAFNAALFAQATALGYRHMILDRRDEVGRILSLELAKLTGVWGRMGAAERYRQYEAGEVQMGPVDVPAAIAHMRLCQSHRAAIMALVARSGLPVRQTAFEDIYPDPVQGRALIHAILGDFGLDRPGDAALEQQITIALNHRGQNSARMMGMVPNIEGARRRLAKAAANLGIGPAAGSAAGSAGAPVAGPAALRSGADDAQP